MNVRDIVVGGRYVVELAPKHPIRRRRLCTVVEIIDRDNIRVTYERYVPVEDTDRPLPGGPSKLITVATHAPASQFLYDEAERERRIADQERRAREAWGPPKMKTAPVHDARPSNVVPLHPEEVTLAGLR